MAFRLYSRGLFERYTLSTHLVEILPFDNVFLGIDIAQRMVSKGKRSKITQKFTFNVDPEYKYREKIHGGLSWLKMDCKDLY